MLIQWYIDLIGEMGGRILLLSSLLINQDLIFNVSTLRKIRENQQN